MDPLTVSAQFAAYVYFCDRCTGTHRNDAAALQFARENWERFLPLAHDGLGRLLLKIADLPVAVASIAEAPFSSN